MATRTETVYHHTCDLCGKERLGEDLAHLWGPDPKAGKRPQVDICPGCQDRPVAEVLAWFREQQDAAQAVKLRAPGPGTGGR